MEEYITAVDDIKIAFYMVNHWSEPGEGPVPVQQPREADRIKQLAAASDLVFVITDELNPEGLICQSDLRSIDHVWWIIPGTAFGMEHRIIVWLYHIWRIKQLYTDVIGEHLTRLDPYVAKPFYFDALLGTQKPHRLQVYQSIQQSGLGDRIIHSLGPNPGQELEHSMWHDPAFHVDPSWQSLPGSNYRTLNQQMLVSGCYVQMPNALPIQVYNQSAYSIVCETWYSNSAIMVTEKLAKAVIGRRLFVVFTGAGYLRFLRSEGFKTFGDVIDESYDDIEDDRQRWHAAFEQVRELCAMDQAQVLARIRPTVDHNYLHVMNRDLEQPPFDKITRLILDHVG